MTKQFVALISKSSGNRQQIANQDRALTILKARGINVEILDAMDPSIKALRSRLFEISGIRGNYPQFFVRDGGEGDSSSYKFFGGFDHIEDMNEMGTLTTEAIGVGASSESTTAVPDQREKPTSARSVPSETKSILSRNIAADDDEVVEEESTAGEGLCDCIWLPTWIRNLARPNLVQ